jgi:adenylate kinase family enzyme
VTPQRIAVIGPTAAGKTTLARALAARLDFPHVELDAIYHQPGWTPLPTNEFRAQVAEVVSQSRWVIDGNYQSELQDLVLARADTVVWLRMPRRLVMRQVLRRTTKRVLSREHLWNGNRESLRNAVSLDPERSIVAWAWRKHGKDVERYDALRAAAGPAQQWLVLRSRGEVRRAADTL